MAAKPTFQQFKQGIIDREKKLEINQLFHLFVKAKTYSDIIHIVKSTTNYEWALTYGTISESILSDIPIEDLEAENIFNITTEITNPSKDVIVRTGGDVTVNLTGTHRIKIILFDGKATVNTNDESMAEIEAFNSSNVTVICKGNSFCHLTTHGNSISNVELKENSISKVDSKGKSDVTVDIQDDGYLNSITLSESYLKIKGNINNAKLYKRENSIISRQTK